MLFTTFFNQPTLITETSATLNHQIKLFYGANQQRFKAEQFKNGIQENTRFYTSKYLEREDDHTTGTCRFYHYIYGDNGVVAVFVLNKTAGTDSMYYIHTDHLGSYCAITKENKQVRQRNYFDVWGNNIGTANFTLTRRGFTGHEHYPELKIINMNGRLYDPVIGRFFSPDKYVANSTFTQDFNRYTYCRNNPLMYTDPSGEFIYALVAMIVYGGIKILTGNWNGGESAKQTFMVGLGALGIPSAGVTGLKLLQFGVQQAGNMFLSQHASINLNVGDFSFSVSPGLGFNPSSGLTWGVNAGANYRTNNGWDFSVGVGGGTNHFGWGGAVSYKGYGLGYGQTTYGGAHAQTTGTASILFPRGSFRLENDFLARNGDRWRTNAFEIQYKNFLFGTSVYTNDPNGTSGVDLDGVDRMGNRNKNTRKNEFGAWEEGQVYSSPIWVGYRYGNNVIRIGYSDPMVQDRTQNWVHRNGFLYLPFGHQNFYNRYDYFQYGPYYYSGYYNPFSLY